MRFREISHYTFHYTSALAQGSGALLLTFALLLLVTTRSDAQEREEGSSQGSFRLIEENGRYKVEQDSMYRNSGGEGGEIDREKSVAGGSRERIVHAWEDEREADSEIHAVVNARDTGNLVAAAMTYDGIAVYASHDFGKSWRRAHVEAGGDPVLVSDADGMLYLVVLRAAALYRYSSDGGDTWHKPVNDTISRGTSGNDKPWMAADRGKGPFRNSLYAVMAIESEDRQMLVVRRKRAGEQAFAPDRVRIADNSFVLQQFAGIDVALDGTIHIAFWGMKSNETHTGVWHVYSLDGGETFSEPRKIAVMSGTITEIFGGDYRIPGDVSPGPVIQVAIDRSDGPHAGRAYVMWDDKRKVGERKYLSDIYLAYSDDGDTWSERLRVNDVSDERSGHHFMGSMTVNDRGIVCASWYDGSEAEDNSRLHAAAAFSADGGVSFTPSIRATSATTNLPQVAEKLPVPLGHYSQVIATDHYLIPFWSDGRTTSTVNLYSGFIPIEAGASSVERVESLDGDDRLLEARSNITAGSIEATVQVPAGAAMRLTLTDVAGTILRTCLDDMSDGTRRNVVIDGHDLPAGTYFLVLETDFTLTARRITIMR